MLPDTSIGEVLRTFVIGIVIGPLTSAGLHLEYAETAVKNEQIVTNEIIF